jgi:preprotein translocase subunit YajC
MIEVNAAVFLLLIEALVLTIIIFAAVMFFVIKKRRRKRVAIAQLVSQIKKQSELRLKETGSFLKDIYQLDDDDLAKAVKSIDKSEKQFFQNLIDSYLTEEPALIASIDASVAGMIDTYKELKPKQPEVDNSVVDERDELKKQIQILEESNEKLKEELGITKTTMSNMIAEFGNMFGGGSDHEMANFEVVEKLEENVEVKETS